MAGHEENAVTRSAPTDGTDNLAFVSFWLGPVQSQIAAARTVRDLWSGSYLLAWLTRQAMQPLIGPDGCGADAFVTPAVKDNPAVDFRQRDLRSPCLPNRFVAQVPAAGAAKLAEQCRDACLRAWRQVQVAVRGELNRQVSENLPGWRDEWEDSVARLWDRQTESFLEIRIAVLPWRECGERQIGDLLAPDRPGRQGTPADRLWTDRLEVLSGLQGAGKALRTQPKYEPPPDGEGQFGPKCSLMGSYEQLGPAGLAASAEFWDAFAKEVWVAGTRTRRRERLCAVSLVKRFAWPAFFAEETASDRRALDFADTATVAATPWLRDDGCTGSPRLDPREVRQRHKDWSGQWLHWSRRDQDDEEQSCPQAVWETILTKRRLQGRAPAYYAVLMLDGDRLGEKLRAGAGAGHHRAVSRALSAFALRTVPGVVKGNDGVLIYSGGDDALVLLPTGRALACAAALAKGFRDVWRQAALPSPDQATVSAGLVIAHYKEDLRFVLGEARGAEKRAKESGRDALQITVCRRSGERTTALCPWAFVGTVCDWVGAFLGQDGGAGASDRWAYHLYGEMETLSEVPAEAMRAEIRRQVGRAERTTRERLGQGDPEAAGELMAKAFDDYRTARDGEGQPRFKSDGDALRQFVTLCQTASFLARGRDE